MARVADVIQLAISFAVIGLFWLIYPGVMLLIASAIGMAYVLASAGALRGNLLAGRIALVFTATTAIFALLGTSRFAVNGFSYLSGNFAHEGGIYWLPYAFLAIAAGAAVVVLMRMVSARRDSECQP